MEKHELHGLSHEEKLEAAEFFVNADSFAQFELWKENKYDDHAPLEWIQDLSGFAHQVGTLTSRGEEFPVMVSCSFAIINGVYVCFYTSDSLCTDWQLVEDYLNPYMGKYDGGSRRAHTNATNFHHCLHYCRKPY